MCYHWGVTHLPLCRETLNVCFHFGIIFGSLPFVLLEITKFVTGGETEAEEHVPFETIE